jgi:hypothetical protein
MSHCHCHIAALMGLVTQNLAHWLGGACSFCPLLRGIVLVIALVLVGTGSNPAVVVVDNPKFFSTLPQLLLRPRVACVALRGCDDPSSGVIALVSAKWLPEMVMTGSSDMLYSRQK